MTLPKSTVQDGITRFSSHNASYGNDVYGIRASLIECPIGRFAWRDELDWLALVLPVVLIVAKSVHPF